MIIECTKKLAEAMKIKVEEYNEVDPSPFYEWHANLFLFDRRKGVIIMNNKTRYCIVLYGLKAEHFKKFDEVVLAAIKETFLSEGFGSTLVDKYISNCGVVSYTKTHDRSILGQLKEFHINLSWIIEDYIPSENINLVELNKWSGDYLMGATLKYAKPKDLLIEEMNKISIC